MSLHQSAARELCLSTADSVLFVVQIKNICFSSALGEYLLLLSSMSTSRHLSKQQRNCSSSRGRLPTSKRAAQELDTWAERLQEEVNTLIEEWKFSSRDAKEIKTIGEILEADTLREAQEICFQ